MHDFSNHDSIDELDDPSDAYSDGPLSDITHASMFDHLAATDNNRREIAWSEFRERYAPIIAGFAARCGASRQDLEDIVQDVMTSLLGTTGKFVYDPTKGRFRGYLKTCTIRAAIRRAGKNARFQGVPLDELPFADIATEPLWNDIWEEQLVAQALVVVRAECAGSVTFRAFEQYVLLDRSAQMVAQEFGISVDSVYQAKTRMTQQLREAVAKLRTVQG